MTRLIQPFGVGVALAFLYMTFEPVIWTTVNDAIYWPIYEAIFFGLGLGGLLVLTCAVLCYVGLYVFLAVTKPRMKMGDRS